MERIKPLFGQDDKTILLIDSERTLLDEPATAFGDDATLMTFEPRQASVTHANGYGTEGTSTAYQPLTGLSKSGHNPLMIAAQDILLFGIELSTIERDAPMAQLRQRAVQQVRTYEVRAQSLGLAKPMILAARYVICTFLDEMVVTSPWGGAHEWTQESLLSQFHGETYGGQGFFTILQRACEEPQKNQDLLELQFVILSLGFSGKYRVDHDGHRKLESLRDMIMALIQRTRGNQRHTLGIGDAGAVPTRSPRRSVPWLALTIGAVSCLCLLQIALYLLLEQRSLEVVQALQGLKLPSISQSVQPISSL